MKRAFLLIVCLTLLACAKSAEEAAVQSDAAPAARTGPDTAATNSEIRAVVQKHFDVMAAENYEALDSIMHPTALTVGSGGIYTHDERLAHHRAGRIKGDKFDVAVTDLKTFGDDFALVQVDSRDSQGVAHGRPWSEAILVIGLARQSGTPWEIVYFQTVRKQAPDSAVAR